MEEDFRALRAWPGGEGGGESGRAGGRLVGVLGAGGSWDQIDLSSSGWGERDG